jgi:hypothetical protein
MVQERLDFRRQPARRRSVKRAMALADPYDTELLDFWLARALPAEEERLSDPSLKVGRVSAAPLSLRRRFCQLRGVHVPYRLEARFGAKEQGLVQALERFLEDKREPHWVLLVSDLCGLVETRDIVAALRVVLGRKHHVAVVMPYTPEYLVTPPVENGRKAVEEGQRRTVLNEILRLAERRERARLARAIGTLGIPVTTAGPADTLEGLLRQVAAGRVRA